MIQEAYCSLEVAKLLKEKGFDIPVNYEYHYIIDIAQFHKKKHNFNGIEYRNCSSEWYSAPTHQMAMQWLREVHNIMISPYALSLGYYFEILDLTTRDITGCKPLYQVGVPSKECVLSTYEDAVEAALKYSLENLI